MFTTARYILLTAIRDWLFIALFIALLAAVSVSSFLGGTALVEQQQMATAYISGSARLIIMIGLIIFTCFHVNRMFDNKEVEVILSRPISRQAFVFSYWLGLALLSLAIIIPATVLILFFVVPDYLGLLMWLISLTCEAFVTVAFALFVALMLRSAVSSVLICFGFYFISRMMGFFLILIENTHQGGLSLVGIMKHVLNFISILIPRFDLFAQSKWLVYGVVDSQNIWVFSVQSLIYIPFLLFIAFSDFRRKQF